MVELDKYIRLARAKRQIGTHLLLMPCFWGLAIGSPTGIPALKDVFLFTLGATAARSAGCVINDLSDKDIDKHVDRT